MQQVEVALLVDILQLRMPGANQRTLLVETVFCAGVVEAVRGNPGGGPGRKVLHIGRVAQADLAVLAGLQAQAFDFPRVEHGATEGLRQQAAIVVAQQRNIRQQLTHLQLGR